MTPRERFLCALNRGTPDRVPYCEVAVSASILQALSGGEIHSDDEGGIDEMDTRGSDDEAAISRLLGRDHVSYRVAPPIPAERLTGADGIPFYGDGAIKTRADVDRLDLPDPEGEEVWGGAADFLAEAGDYATSVTTRVGVSPVYLGMGTEAFSIALYEDLALVEAALDRYTDWAARAVREAIKRGFDFIFTADDVAFKTGPFMSPQMFRRIFIPYMRRVADEISAAEESVPWVYHSDGDLTELLPDLLDLGITGFHPVEPEAMDIAATKRQWGDRICLLGNVSVDLLASGSSADVEAEVRRLLREVAPGGGYILSSGNSLASYCRPENVRAMLDTLRQYGEYPIDPSV
jgi:uroporphyrinogen decarboxylase